MPKEINSPRYIYAVSGSWPDLNVCKVLTYIDPSGDELYDEPNDKEQVYFELKTDNDGMRKWWWHEEEAHAILNAIDKLKKPFKTPTDDVTFAEVRIIYLRARIIHGKKKDKIHMGSSGY